MKKIFRRFLPASAILVLLLSALPGCRTANDVAQAELAAFERKLTDDYIVFEKAQEPSDENGFGYGEYYQHLFDPSLNPRSLAIPWLEEFEERHRGTQAGLDATDSILGFLGYDRAMAAEKGPALYSLVLEHYIGFEQLGDICYHGRRCKEVWEYLDFLDAVIDRSPHKSVRAKALMRKLLHIWSEEGSAEQSKSVELLTGTYADEVYKNTPCGELARNYMLPPHPEGGVQVGAEAPDFSGYDVNGRPVALADFKDEVVAIVFFGYW